MIRKIKNPFGRNFSSGETFRRAKVTNFWLSDENSAQRIVSPDKVSPDKVGLWCSGFSRRREREMLVRVIVSWLSQKPRKRNISYGYGFVTFQEAAKEKY